MENLKKLCEIIVDVDMKDVQETLDSQRNMFSASTFLKNALPSNSASLIDEQSIDFRVNSYLMEVPRSPHPDTFEKIESFQDQPVEERQVFMESSSGGSGKTHRTFSLGKRCFSTLIRLSNPAGPQRLNFFSAPWSHLCYLFDLLLMNDTNSESIRSMKAALLLKLLISIYYNISVEILKLGMHWNLPLEKLRELLLRFYSSVDSEKIILQLFKSKSTYLEMNSFISHKNTTKADVEKKMNLVKNYLDYIHSSKNELMHKLKSINEDSCLTFLFCFDDAHVFSNRFPQLFHPEDLLEDEKEQVGNNSSSMKPSSGDLFHGLCSTVKDFYTHYDIAVYMNGRSLFAGAQNSDGKQTIKHCDYFNLEKIKEIFYFYFNFPANYFEENPEIEELLLQFTGRPFYFIDHCFTQFFQNLRTRSLLDEHCEIRTDKFVAFLNERISSLEAFIEHEIQKFYSMYENGSEEAVSPTTKAISSPKSDKESGFGPQERYLLPVLIKGILCESGRLQLNEVVLSEAIRLRIIPTVGNEVIDEETQQLITFIDLKSIEPMSYQCLKKFLLDKLRKNFHYFCSLLSSDVKEPEEFFAYYVTLTASCSPGRSSRLSLYDLFKPLYPHLDPLEKELSRFWHPMRHWFCCVTEVTNAQRKTGDIEEIKCPLELLIDRKKSPNPSGKSEDSNQKGSFNTRRILWNFDSDMGISLAFIAVDETGSKVSLVAIQSTTALNGRLKYSLMELSPGSQYLTHQERKQLIQPKEKWTVSSHRNSKNGIFSTKWNAFRMFCLKYPELSEKWIRISLMGKIPSKENYQYLHHTLPKKLSSSEVGFAKDFQAQLLKSPILLLSYNSPHWLTEPIRQVIFSSFSLQEENFEASILSPLTPSTPSANPPDIFFFPFSMDSWKFAFRKEVNPLIQPNQQPSKEQQKEVSPKWKTMSTTPTDTSPYEFIEEETRDQEEEEVEEDDEIGRREDRLLSKISFRF
jgi:hypothetical protein